MEELLKLLYNNSGREKGCICSIFQWATLQICTMVSLQHSFSLNTYTSISRGHLIYQNEERSSDTKILNKQKD